MPLVKRSIEHHHALADGAIYQNSQPSEVLDDVCLAAMTGVLGQLGWFPFPLSFCILFFFQPARFYAQ